MNRRTATLGVIMLASSVSLAGLSSIDLLAQRATPADVAARLSGTWKINLELSPQLRPAAGGLLRSPGAPVVASAPGSRTTLALQRGGGRGGGGGATPAPPDPRVMTGNRALQFYQQVPPEVQIEATAESVTFTDPRGARTYEITNKTVRVDLENEAYLTMKSRWDRNTLRQEFIFDETKVSHAYEVNNEGTQIQFTMRVDNFSGGVGRQVRGVYEKQ